MPRLFDIEYKPLSDLGVATQNPDALVMECDQGSQDWFGARLGIMTASNAKLLIKANGEPAKSDSLKTFMNGCIAEQLLGTVEMQTGSTPAMERGTNLEPRARAWYGFEREVDVMEVGFIYRDGEKTSGVSPDGICKDRGLEIKCPMHKGMIGKLLMIAKTGKAPSEYLPQIQFGMWATGLEIWDFVMWTPEPQIPDAVLTVEKDEKAHGHLDELVPKFTEGVRAGVEKLTKMQEGE